MDDVIKIACERLFPEKILEHDFSLKYSGHFSNYNASASLYKNQLRFRLSRNWEGISDEIKIGLIQSLMCRIFKQKQTSLNIDIYNSFIKNMHISIEKNNIDPILKESFERVSKKYFLSVEIPNLQWGLQNYRKLGSYDFQSDTITITSLLKDYETQLLDYVIYHELLHKKFKFSTGYVRNRYHSKEFRDAEKAFENSNLIEGKLNQLRPKKRRNSLSQFFDLRRF